MNNDQQNIDISYFIDEVENEKIIQSEYELDILNLLHEEPINEEPINEEPINNDLILSKMLNYNDNFTIKELLLICDYYGMARELKNNKCNKEKIIHFLVDFESNDNNSDIVNKRLNMWFYIYQLKNDKFMKKYVFW
jgi:hypothetical protein